MIVRKGVKEDLKQVYDLVVELAVYEDASHEVMTTIEEMEKDGFGPDPVFGFHVVENNEGIIGVSIYYYRYST